MNQTEVTQKSENQKMNERLHGVNWGYIQYEEDYRVKYEKLLDDYKRVLDSQRKLIDAYLDLAVKKVSRET